MSNPRLKKYLLTLLIVLLVVVTVIPFIIGRLIKHDYDQLIAFYNSQGNVSIVVTDYQAHWFSAKARLTVSVKHPLLERISQMLAKQNMLLPASLSFTVDQHIQYGPILYRQQPTRGLAVELAYMYSEINLAPELAKIIHPINPYEPIIVIVDNLSFAGKFKRDFRSAGFRIIFPDAATKLELRNFNAETSVWPWHRIKGKIKMDDVLMVSRGISFIMPNLSATFDRQHADSGLWVGDTGVSISRIYARDENKSEIYVTDFVTDGHLSESDGLLNGTREFKIGKVQSNDVSIGPVIFKISSHDLIAKSLAHVLEGFEQNLLAGESVVGTAQLLSNIPAMITNHSSVVIDNFYAETPNGNLQFNARVNWPQADPKAKASVFATLRQTDVHANLRITQPLAKILLALIAELSNVDEPKIYSAKNPADKEAQIKAATHQNDILIVMLVENHQMPATVNTQIAAMIKKNVSLDEYTNALNQFVAQKQITQVVMDMLHTQYATMQFIAMPAEERREVAAKNLMQQFDQWLRDGYVTPDKDDYTTTLLYQNGKVKINGKSIQD